MDGMIYGGRQFEVRVIIHIKEYGIDVPVELPWFGEAPGYYNTHTGGMVQYPAGGYAYPMQAANAPIVQTPGHSIVIQPGMNGHPPTITQVPLGVA